MIKPTLFLITAVILFFTGTSFIADDKISVIQEIPAVAFAGDEFTVTVKIHKGDASGAARLQFDLPAGFSAIDINSSGADFIFEEQKAKFIWTKLTTEKEMVVSYKLKTTKDISGIQTINGVFVCIINGKTERNNITPAIINIQQKGAGEVITDATENINTANPTITRKLEIVAHETGEYKMEITINPNNITQGAKFMDEMPANFQAEPIEDHNAHVTIDGNTIAFYWENLPKEKEFKISYYARSGEPGPKPEINGYFTFDDLANKSEPKQIIENQVSSDNLIKTVKEPEPVASSNNISKATVVTNNNTSVSKISSFGQTGISYRVQVSATKKSSAKNSQWFHLKYNINSDVEMTYHEGWKKYITGNFTTIEEAFSFRNKTREKIPDAFIVAYENGMRITLEEAKRNKSLNQ